MQSSSSGGQYHSNSVGNYSSSNENMSSRGSGPHQMMRQLSKTENEMSQTPSSGSVFNPGSSSNGGDSTYPSSSNNINNNGNSIGGGYQPMYRSGYNNGGLNMNMNRGPGGYHRGGYHQNGGGLPYPPYTNNPMNGKRGGFYMNKFNPYGGLPFASNGFNNNNGPQGYNFYNQNQPFHHHQQNYHHHHNNNNVSHHQLHHHNANNTNHGQYFQSGGHFAANDSAPNANNNPNNVDAVSVSYFSYTILVLNVVIDPKFDLNEKKIVLCLNIGFFSLVR